MRLIVGGVVGLLVGMAACGDDGLSPAPPTISAGPVTIDTRTMTLTLGSSPALVQPQFLSIGTATTVEEAHYYDPRGDDLVTLAPIKKAIGSDGDWVVLEGKARIRLTECELPGCAILDIDAVEHEDAVQVSLALPRDAGEPLYGTGDAAIRANVAGTVREMSLRVDTMSDSSLNETHVPVPLALWPRRGAGLFVADDRPGAFDLGAADPTRVTATFTLPARGSYRVFLYTAAQPLDLVRTYVALTAKPAVPPRWAFAPQQWRNVHQNTGEILDDMTQMRTRRLPGSVMWIDNPWQTAYNTFVVDETRFAQIDAAIADLTANGYKVLFWSTPYVGKSPLSATDRSEGIARDLFVTNENGMPFDWPWQDGPGLLVDFTREGAIDWWRERINRVVARGADGFKLDFGEELVPDLGGNIVQFLLAEGDNSTHHNRYAQGYHAAYLGALPLGDGFLITRTGAWGEQAYNTAIWPGDLDSDFSEHGVLVGSKRSVGGLPSAISRGLSLSVSGYPFYGSDIGGFKGFPTTEALIRWAQYASLGTIMQLGGGGKSHNPWDTTLFTARAEAIYKRYADLHMQLNPLLWTLALRAGGDGTPLTVPACFLYDCGGDDAAFFLGSDIFVAPVITAGATSRVVTLPPGQWVDRNTGIRVAGGTSITVPAPLDTLPMWQRVDSIVPMFARYADTLVQATAPGVTSYADPVYGRELRLVHSPGGGGLPLEGVPISLSLHDGARGAGWNTDLSVTGGTQYTVFTLDVDARGITSGPFSAPAGVRVDGVDLAIAADQLALETCATPGCWHFDTTTQRFQARVFAATGETRAIVVR